MTSLDIRCTMVSVLALKKSGAETEVLLLRRANDYLKGVWSYAGGHIEQGETAWQAARRELEEETGLIPEAFYATSFCEQVYFAPQDCIMLVPSFVAWVDSAASVELNVEHSDWRWEAFASAMEIVPFGSQRELFAHVYREFIERTPSEQLLITQ